MDHKAQLQQKLNERSATAAVIGMGYVGLPLAVEFAKVGFHVIGVDTDPRKVEKLNRGESYIPDIQEAELRPLVESGHLRATTDYNTLAQADTVNICVPTPLRKTKDPDMSFVISAVDSIAEVAHPGMLIVLESTTYPGTTHEIVRPRIEARGLKTGEDVFIAFSPERIDPGNKTYGVHNTPKVVGGVTPHCADVAHALYQHAVAEVVPVSSPTAAEMVKLLENTFRAVNIGLVNEVALMCDRLGIDAWEVIEAAATKPFGFMPFYPGPGLGGHCIPVDPHYLSWKLKTLNYNARFIELASEINTSMPIYVVDKVTNALNDDGKAVRGSQVLVLGVAYKRDVDDVRESPALDIIGLLQQKGAAVLYNDPYVPQVHIEGETTLQSTAYSPALLAECDCVVIVTNHSSYNYAEITEHARLIVDTRHATAETPGKARVVML